MQQKIKTLQNKVADIYIKIYLSTPINTEEREVLEHIITLLDQGEIRVATYDNNTWTIHEWIKQAILAYVHYTQPKPFNYGMQYYDHTHYKYDNQPIKGKRIVPGAFIRYGAYISDRCIIMPSFINFGAYIGKGTQIDTYASIGCCAQIGENVHISAGTGIGGVLEPLQARPTIIEDNCFIGARSEVSEGVIVKSGAVLASGLFISQSTRIYNRETGEISYGVIPENSVVVPGSVPSKDGKYNLAAAIIVKQADERTRSKTQINNLLRSFDNV